MLCNYILFRCETWLKILSLSDLRGILGSRMDDEAILGHRFLCSALLMTLFTQQIMPCERERSRLMLIGNPNASGSLCVQSAVIHCGNTDLGRLRFR